VFYASNLSTDIDIKSKYSSFFNKSFHTGAFLGISLTAYPLATLIPNLNSLPPFGFNKDQSVFICDNSEFVTHMQPPPTQTGPYWSNGTYVGPQTTYFDWTGLKSTMYIGGVNDAQNPIYIVNMPLYSRCMIYLNPEKTSIFVQFGGTQGSQNLVTDLTFFDKTWSIGGRTVNLHQGFYDAYMSIEAPVLSSLKTLLAASPQVKKVVVCGHSLGGALATVSAISLQFSDLPNQWKGSMEVFTLGSPQVGSRNFVDLFDSTIRISVRAANPIDMIPRVLDGVLFHVKGYFPVISFYTKVGNSHFASTYSSAIGNWNLARVLIYTTLPIFIAAATITIIYYVTKHGAAYYKKVTLLSSEENPTLVQKLLKVLKINKFDRYMHLLPKIPSSEGFHLPRLEGFKLPERFHLPQLKGFELPKVQGFNFLKK
jgi:hypothetical protein